MTNSSPTGKLSHSKVTRRNFLVDGGRGLAGIALAALLAREGRSQAAPLTFGVPHLPPRAKSVIWFCMLGGTSHVESFDPKPALNLHAGKTFQETPYGEAIVKSPYYRSNVRDFAGTPRDLMPKVYPLQTGFRKWGESGLEISDWWPEVGACADRLALVRSMWTTDNDHAAQLQIHTGRHIFDGFHPSIGSWVHYGLGSLNDNLPQFIVLGGGPGDCCGGRGAHGASYLGPEHAGVPLTIDPGNPLPFGRPARTQPDASRQAAQRALQALHELRAAESPQDAALRARIQSFELAFRMQRAIPEVVRLQEETAETQSLYGIDQPSSQRMGQMCLAARRLVERGVRFVQIYDDGWDAHSKLKENHSTRCAAVDRPIGGLLRDLERRGLLDETLVVWTTEFGRTPGAERSDGRDHHPYGFSVWLAGGGVRGGVAHGATDELGFHAVQDRHYVTDLHATVLKQLGLDAHRLEHPGHKRLEIDFGHPIDAIIA